MLTSRRGGRRKRRDRVGSMGEGSTLGRGHGRRGFKFGESRSRCQELMHSSCLTCFSASGKLRPGETDKDGGKGRTISSSLDTRGESGQLTQVS